MRVLDMVAYLIDYQLTANFSSQKEQIFAGKNSSFEHNRMTINGIRAVIDIESWWVYIHIKLRYEWNQRAMDAKTQFDLAVNPP